jgi:uncharacterized OB-fold protein
MTVTGSYLGMELRIDAFNQQNLAYFRHCAAGTFHLQRCTSCHLLRYPPTTACPWCSHPDARWTPVEGVGTVHSYAEVHHAIQPAFRNHLPYLIPIVELDTQRGQPNADDALRVAGNLATPDGALARPELVAQIGIDSRVRMILKDIAPGLAIPLWTPEPLSARACRFPDCAPHP